MEREDVLLKQLSIGYHSGKQIRTVVQHITATIQSGSLTCLLGANGVGKSTLLRTLSAFQPKLGGSIFIGQREITDFTPAELSRTVGVVLTEKPEVRHMTVHELVCLGRAPYTGFWGTCSKDDLAIVGESLQQAGISELASRLVETLSDGERQKVMIAKVLAQQTPVIYLDEPTAFLDYPSKVEMMLLLRHISQQRGKTVFLSTHDLELALQVADCIWLLQRSGTLSIGSPRELAAQGILKTFVEQRQGITFDNNTLTIKIDKAV